MTFTVCSRGRPIGVTELAFAPVLPYLRSGWFHPNDEGERLMPVIASVLPAIRALNQRARDGVDGVPLTPPELYRCTEAADLREAFHRENALELTLHRADGSLVPTVDIGIKDTEQLLAAGREHFEDDEVDEAELEPHIREAIEHDMAIILEAVEEAEAERGFGPDEDAWRGEETAMPRYQIHVHFAGEASS